MPYQNYMKKLHVDPSASKKSGKTDYFYDFSKSETGKEMAIYFLNMDKNS